MFFRKNADVVQSMYIYWITVIVEDWDSPINAEKVPDTTDKPT